MSKQLQVMCAAIAAMVVSGCTCVEDTTPLNCRQLFDCIAACTDSFCEDECIGRATPSGKALADALAACSDRNSCTTEQCLSASCDSELRACAAVPLQDGGVTDGGKADSGVPDSGVPDSGVPGCLFNTGMPQLTGPLTGIAASYAKGGQMMVGVPVDLDTRRVTITIYDYNSPLQLGSSADDVTPGTTLTLPITAGVSTAPAGTYYFSVDLCSTTLCTSPLQKNLHERKAMSSTLYTETRTITGMGIVETCSTGIPIQTFQIQ